jgi:hypothetical protein
LTCCGDIIRPCTPVNWNTETKEGALIIKAPRIVMPIPGMIYAGIKEGRGPQ